MAFHTFTVDYSTFGWESVNFVFQITIRFFRICPTATTVIKLQLQLRLQLQRPGGRSGKQKTENQNQKRSQSLSSFLVFFSFGLAFQTKMHLTSAVLFAQPSFKVNFACSSNMYRFPSTCCSCSCISIYRFAFIIIAPAAF